MISMKEVRKQEITNNQFYETFGFWLLEIGVCLVIGLPARSPASRSLAEGRRFARRQVLGIWSSAYQR